MRGVRAQEQPSYFKLAQQSELFSARCALP